MLDRGDIAIGGGGSRGGGTCSPSPVSHAPTTLLLVAGISPRDTQTLLRPPPPHPRLRRSFPAPGRGRGPCVAISGEQPCPALLQDLPMHWTVGISPRGVGLTGRGNSFPLPCFSRSNHLTSRRQATQTLLPASPPRPRLRQGIPISFCRHPHPARACGAPPPPPPGGGVRAWRYQVSSRARGGAGGKSVSGSFPPIPWHWTVWISPRGERLTGRGNLFPLPCLPHSNHLTSRR